MITTSKHLIPEGASGDWRVERFTVSEDEAKFHNLRCRINARSEGREIEAGTYTRLMRGGTVVMSDTPAEIRDHANFIYKAAGRVFINGLGLGVCAAAVLDKPSVDQVIVIEISPDVINLIVPTLKERSNGKLTIFCADAFAWQPPRGVRYGAVWHDIWDNICGDNVEEMKKLRRKYGRRCDWQGCWCEVETLRANR